MLKTYQQSTRQLITMTFVMLKTKTHELATKFVIKIF